MKRLNALQYGFLVLIGCLAGLPTLAATEMLDDAFEYPAGAYSDSTWGSAYIVSDYSKAGNSARVDSTHSLATKTDAPPYSNPLPIGQQSFWIYPIGEGNTIFYWTETTHGYTSPQWGFNIQWNGSTYNVKTNYATYCTINKNAWSKIIFRWDCVNHGTASGDWFISCDDGVSWSAAQQFDPQYNSHWDGLKSFSVSNNTADGIRLDTFGNPVPPVVAGWYPILAPTAPVSGITNTIDFDNFNITGSISIPTDNTYIWKVLYATFTNSAGIESVTKEIALPDMDAGDTFNYSATSTIENATSTDVYKVSYSAWGYWCDPAHPEYCGKLGLSYPFEIVDTYISEGSTPAGGIPPLIVSQWTPPTLENCDLEEYSILEKLTCQIQNALLGLVIPSAASVNNLFGVFQTFQQKFPFSYLNEISSSFNNVRTALNESATISIKVFGQAGNVSLAFWSTACTIGGITTTIGATIKALLTFFLFLIFLAWGIGYLHRIL